jgi:magnesium transporter
VPHRHAPETAGHLAVSHVPIASLSETVAATRRRLETDAYDIIDLVLVTDPAGRYRGAVETKRIVQAGGEQLVGELVSDWPAVAPETDQEHAVEAASRAHVAALPVVADDGRPLGVIPPATLLDVLAREHREDLHRIVGVLRERAGAEHALEDPPLQRASRRLPWLLVGLAMSSAATGAMAGFEQMLQANVAVAFFVPAIVYLTDAIGTQTEAIAVRGLSLRKLSLGRILAGEIVTGGMIGLALAVVAFLAVWLVFGSVLIAAGVAISLFAAGTLASTLGLLLPWLLSQANIDPAFGSGPVATIIQDVVTILIYFLVMTALLPAGA